MSKTKPLMAVCGARVHPSYFKAGLMVSKSHYDDIRSIDEVSLVFDKQPVPTDVVDRY